MSEPIRILHVFGTMDRGGAESRTMDLYRHLDREKVQFDFLVHTNKTGHFEAEIKEMGGRIYRVPRFLFYNYFSYRQALRDFFRAHQDFPIIQGHMTSTAAIYLPIAKRAGVPVTVAHARNAGVAKGLKGLLTRMLRYNLHKKADYLFTCSRLAALAVFGREAVEKGRTTYIPNAIEVEKYRYDETVRAEIRKQNNLAGQFVIGHVGRFIYQKNHEYLLKIFHEVQKRFADSRLLLLGEGNELGRIKALAKELGILDKIIFIGNVPNAWDYYQAMDYFVFPSRFEGLPGCVVEAQASGLKCLISDAIADEVRISDSVKAMDIHADPVKWADFIIKSRDYSRKRATDVLEEAGFDVKRQAMKMEAFYLNPPQKIMLIVPNLCQGGFQRVCINTARLLAPFFAVVIVIFDAANMGFDVEGLKIIDIRQGVKSGKIAKLMNIAIRAFKVKKLKRFHKVHVAYSFGATANIVNALSKTPETKGWLSLHSYMDVGEKFKIRLFLRKADRLLCCSKGIAEEIRERYHYDRAVTLYNPHDIVAMRQLADLGGASWPWVDDGDRSGQFIHLISMGREDDVKGFWHTIKVFYLVQKKFPQARLTILGEGKFGEYKKLAADLGIIEKVYFAGMQKNPYPYLKEGQIYLLNSFFEGFPNALIEAMVLGMVAVACDCRTGPAEILLEDTGHEEERKKIYQEKGALWGEYGVLVPVMDEIRRFDAIYFTAEEKKMAAVVERLLSDDELYKKYRTAALKRVRDFTSEAYLGRIIDMHYFSANKSSNVTSD